MTSGAGNIQSKSETVNGETTTHSYTYGDGSWQDLLTAYDGESITYNASGDPLSYRGWTFSWNYGSLSTASKDGVSVSYFSTSDGLRLGKTVGTEVHSYFWANGRLSAELVSDTSDKLLMFLYDETGMPLGFTVSYSSGASRQEYYYVTNLQGDVIAIVNGSGSEVARYSYNAWGELLSVTDVDGSGIAGLNPLRYRGYYYDSETGLYYLQSRYYDPEVGRFISADEFPSTGQGFIGTNMFAYCGNNPVTMTDLTGALGGWLIGAVVGGLIGGISAALQGEDILAGAAEGAVSGAIAGAAVDIAVATVATGGALAVVGAGLIAFGGGFAGSIAGEEAKSVVSGEGLKSVDGGMIKRAISSGMTNLLSFGVGSGLNYAFGGKANFNTSPKIKDIFADAFGESFVLKIGDRTFGAAGRAVKEGQDLVSAFYAVMIGTIDSMCKLMIR